jgi:hypothetical protein
MLVSINLEDFDRFIRGACGKPPPIIVENSIVLTIERSVRYLDCACGLQCFHANAAWREDFPTIMLS